MIEANGTFTIKSPRGGHRTFRIRTEKGLDGKRVVSMLTGPDNESSYQAFGFVGDRVSVWRRLRGTDFETYGRMLDRLLAGINNGLGLVGYEVLSERKCRRCNRKLTTPESIESGIGPECARKE